MHFSDIEDIEEIEDETRKLSEEVLDVIATDIFEIDKVEDLERYF